MAVKMTGAEWKRFYNDPEAWPEGAWHDDEEILVNGEQIDGDYDLTKVPDAATLTLAGGAFFLKDMEEGPSLETHFKRWRKRQTTEVFVVEVPREAAEAVRLAIAAAGGKVVA